MALGVLLFAKQIENLPLTCLAAILILAGFQAIKPREIGRVWHTSRPSAAVFLLTLTATLFMPVQRAIFLGVAIQVFLYIFQNAERMAIMELVETEDGDFEEHPAPKQLPDNAVTVLLPYGSLFFAAARDFEEEAPVADESQHAVVVLMLRGRLQLGSTAIGVFERYSQVLQANGGRLYLAEVGDSVRDQLERTSVAESIGPDCILPAGERVVASQQRAVEIARAWLAETTSEEQNV